VLSSGKQALFLAKCFDGQNNRLSLANGNSSMFVLVSHARY
jgi:hypothetical protein